MNLETNDSITTMSVRIPFGLVILPAIVLSYALMKECPIISNLMTPYIELPL